MRQQHLPRLWLIFAAAISLVSFFAPSRVYAEDTVVAEAPQESQSSVAELDSEDNIKTEMQQIDEAMAKATLNLRTKAALVNRYHNGARGAQFAWEEEPAAKKGRRVVTTYLEVEVRSLLNQLELLDKKKEELTGDLELLRVRNEETKKSEALKQAKKRIEAPSHFVCSELFAQPDNEKLEILQPFGKHHDKDTGLEWKSSGWWLGNVKDVVKACATGIVVYAGKVAGRGQVVLLDHGGGSMTLYANLNEDTSSRFLKGTKVVSGAVLGTVRDRLYFEVRKQGEALDPKLALSASQVAQIKF